MRSLDTCLYSEATRLLLSLLWTEAANHVALKFGPPVEIRLSPQIC